MPPDPAVGSDSDECVGASSSSRVSEREIKLKLDVLPYEVILCLCSSLVKGTLFCKNV